MQKKLKFQDIKEKIKNIEKIGEGWRASVYKGIFEDKVLSFKVALSDLHKHPIQKEGIILQQVNKHGIGSPLRFSGEDFIAYDYIDGKPLIEVINQSNYLNLINQLLEQSFILDKLKIDKGEMHRPYTNVLVDKDLKLYLIDFERATKSLKPQNVLNVTQFILRGKERTEDLLKLLKEYKLNQSEDNFLRLKDYLMNILVAGAGFEPATSGL
ncbi:MAG: serine/threonine protein kinase [Sulfurihydrogenibium sp.]|nr:MAG: serine/threonine protein kinase [Sulfurihydrogenibium sp.]PMP77851.1 MAG: serine/threonine protein kinase [Sulfurihydrogenibium sp.]